MDWPARPLKKVQLALQNSYLVCSLVLRVTQPTADGSTPKVRAGSDMGLLF